MTNNKHAIIIGATSGIGHATALLLAKKGWSVGIAGRREDILRTMQQNTPGIVVYQYIDVTKDDAPQQLAQLILKTGGMELYFHSSGIGYQNTILDTEKELLTIATNVKGFTAMVNYAFTYFENHPQNHATLAAITSIAGTKGLGVAPSYSASKRFQSNYLESLTQLCSIRHLTNICILDIRPGFVKTPLLGDGNNYPMQLEVGKVATQIVNAIENGRRVAIIDWKYRLLVKAWQIIPRWLWVKMRISSAV